MSSLSMLIMALVLIMSSSQALRCGRGQVRVLKPEGPVCLRDFSQRWNKHNLLKKPKLGGEESAEKFALLPNAENLHLLDAREKECLEQHMIFWRQDRRCYTLLQQGPCAQNEWLVLDNLSDNRVGAVCRVRMCPCTTEEPELCEVQLGADLKGRHGGDDSCHGIRHCVVARAAEQDKICGKGEMLHVTPFGLGHCDCRDHHVRVEGRPGCHRLYAQSEICPPHHTLQLIPVTENRQERGNDEFRKPICVPSLCNDESQVLHQDGRCYSLFTRGPCNEQEIWSPDLKNGDPHCKPLKEHKVKRVFDLAPNVLREARERNSILNHLRAQMNFVCNEDNNQCGNPRGNSQQRGKKNRPWANPILARDFRLSKRDKRIRQFLQWLLSFRP